MKSELWRRAINRYVIPELPGEWRACRGFLYREPADWILHALVFRPGRSADRFSMRQLVQLLAIPSTYVTGRLVDELGHAKGGSYGHYLAPATVSDAAEVMSEITHRIRTDSISVFDQTSTIDRYADAFEASVPNDSRDLRIWENRFYLRLVQGDRDGALEAAARADDAAQNDPTYRPPW